MLHVYNKIILYFDFIFLFAVYPPENQNYVKHFLTLRTSWKDINFRCIQRSFVPEMQQNGRRGLIY